MPNVTVPAAAPGLPENAAVLAEADHGLAIVRPAGLKALRPSFLTVEEADYLLSLLDGFVNSEQVKHYLLETHVGSQNDPDLKAADEEARRLRRAMIPLLKKVRDAKSKTLDDILFKALIVEGVEAYECRHSKTLGHSIVNDLLSADCMWRAS